MKSLTGSLLLALASSALALGGNPNVQFKARRGAFSLIQKGRAARVLVDPADWPGVARAASDLRKDLGSVAGSIAEPAGSSPTILIGTIGHSPIIDGLIRSGRIQVGATRDKWEACVTQVVQLPDTGTTLVIAGSDKRGTIYGIYDLSQALGVSPWKWWEDVPIRRHPDASIIGRYEAPSPKVKYRGIFLNDEAPSLSNWVAANYGTYNHFFYERIFELLLRLRANYLWPAMWNSAFSADDPENPKNADEYGIVMGTSHVEPMMRADKEWGRAGFSERDWNYSTHPKELEAFWSSGVVRNKPYENIVTKAMRGKVDTPMSETANIGLLEKIVAAQRRILASSINPDLTQIPQLWCLYKEVQEYYEKGMRVPEDITLLWADDNWGNIRRLPTSEERSRSGGAGVYYHFDYVGGPRNYKWIDTNPIPKIWEQMHLAYESGADRIWIVNVGDLKPKPFATEFFLTLAQDPEKIRSSDLARYAREWAEREFGGTHAAEIGGIMMETGRLNGRRKPELCDADTYSLTIYDEAERVNQQFSDLLNRAEKVGSRLPDNCQAAYFEEVLHGIKAGRVLNDLYLATAKNHLYAKQGRASTNDWARAASDAFAKDAAVTEEYHSLNGGKWNHFMDQTHIGYTSWQQPDKNVMPKLETLTIPALPALGVSARPGGMEFTRFGQDTGTIDLFNKGGGKISYHASASVDWVRLDPAEGRLDDSRKELTMRVQVDWTRVPVGTSRGILTIGSDAGSFTVPLSALVPSIFGNAPLGSFLEGDHLITIEAHHTTGRTKQSAIQWETLRGYGKTDSAVTPLPTQFLPFRPGKGPKLEYRVMVFTTGAAQVVVSTSPSLAFHPGHGLRLGVSLDDGPIQLVDTSTSYLSHAWEISVINSENRVSVPVQLTAGPHRLQLWAIDPGVVVQRVLLDLGGLKSTNLGPVESKQAGDSGTD